MGEIYDGSARCLSKDATFDISLRAIQFPERSEMLEIILALNVIQLGLDANRRFLAKQTPDLEAVRQLAEGLVERADYLETLVKRL
ncbi:hypothetical protein [Pararhizobium sp. PWRC1-1]|uniref:hypothetical protein n=1 Tax=Pararhizobium sp. PWRC1-1 TaxID=2804566 RepID=UPI003CFA4993